MILTINDIDKRLLLKHKVRLMESYIISLQSTCIRRNVGCVGYNNDGMNVGNGFNGVPKGIKHCKDSVCGGEKNKPGENLNSCISPHAEINFLMMCKEPRNLKYLYVTTFPCIDCMRGLSNTSVECIIYMNDYTHQDSYDRWLNLMNRDILKINFDDKLLNDIKQSIEGVNDERF